LSVATRHSPRPAARQPDFFDRLLDLWPELMVLIAVVVTFAPILAGTSHFPYDAEYFHYPLLRAVQQDLSGGHLPAWDAYSYGGLPLLANAQSAWLYPPNLVLDGVLTLSGSPLNEHLLDVVLVLHYLAAAILTVRLARRRGLSDTGSAFAGVFVVSCGQLIAQAEHSLMIEALPWIPLALLLIDELASRTTPGRIAALGLACALIITAGFLPLVPSAFVLFGLWALLRPEGRFRALGGCAAGVALGVALAAAALLPILAQSSVYPVLQLHGGLSTHGALTAILPNVFGHWAASPLQYHGPPGPTNTYYYLGGAAVVLIPLGLMSSSGAKWELGVVAIILLLSFGAPASWVVNEIQFGPVTKLWRPEDFAFVAAVPLALLPARGLDRVPTLRSLIASLGVVVVLVAIPFRGPSGTVHFLLNAPPQTDLACLGALALLAVAARRPALGRRWLLGIVALLAAADLVAAVPGRYFVESPGAGTSAGPQLTGDDSTVLSFLRSTLKPGQRVMADVKFLPSAWHGFANIWHVSDANGFQPQFSKYQLARIALLAPGFNGRVFPLDSDMLPYMEEMNAPYAVVATTLDPLAGAPGFKRVFTSGIYRVYRARGRFHRAYAIRSGCRPLSTRAGLTACLAPGTVATHLSGQSTRSFTLHGPVTEVITGEVWYPGWQAMAGGSSLPVRRVGYMAAVRIPKGVSRFTMTYSTPGLLPGAVISGLALILCAAISSPPLRRRLRLG
jgi:hypothetical protein